MQVRIDFYSENLEQLENVEKELYTLLSKYFTNITISNSEENPEIFI